MQASLTLDQCVMKLCPICKEGAWDTAQTCPRCETELDPSTYRPGSELSGLVLAEKYVLQDFLQEGGMGWVYRGRHMDLGSDVAVKLMKPSAKAERNRGRRFEREARAASRLSNPHIISVMDFGRTPGSLLYLVTEYVRGITLTEELQRNGPMRMSRVLRIFSQLCSALDEAHLRHVIHRDLKPDNVMLSQLRPDEDFIKILDFGIAKIATPTGKRLTMVGEVCGTPAYMAPEQIRGKQITVQTDIYACGVLLYELLTGVVPLEGQSVEETLSKHLYEDPPPLNELVRDRKVPPEFNDIVNRAMAKKPRDRFRNVSELRDAVFKSVTKGDHRAVPCTACHRSPDSALGFCSQHCATSSDDVYEELIFEFPDPGAPEKPSADRKLETGVELDLRRPERSGSEDLAVSLAETVERTALDDGVRPLSEDMLSREEECEQIREYFAGDSGVLEIVGSPGTGKTTLLGEVSRQARAQRRPLLTCGPDPTLGRTPWYAVRSLVRQALDLPGGSSDLGLLRRHTLKAGLVVDDVAPLALLLRPTGPVMGADPDVLLREITAAVLRVLLRRDGGRRATVIVDDAGQLDGASLRFMRRLCTEVQGSQLKLVVASDRALLGGEEPRTSIYLGPVGTDEVRTLLLARASRDSADLSGVVQTLTHRSSGLLLHLDQALRYMDEGGEQLDQPLEVLVRLRFGMLPGAARRLLQTLAVIGLRAPVALLERLLGHDTELEPAREALESGGWLQRGTADELVMQHPLIADLVRRDIATDVRRTLHRGVLELVEPSGELAHMAARHAFEARIGQTSMELQERAGDLATVMADPESAAMIHYRRALDVARWELYLGEEDPRFQSIALKMGCALRVAGHLLSAEVVLKEALSASAKDSKLRASLQLELGRVCTARARYDEAAELARDGIRLAILSGDRELMVALYIDLGAALLSLDQPSGAIKEVEEGILLVTGGEGTKAAAPVKELWRLLALLGQVHSELRQLPRALIASEQAVMLAHREGHNTGEATCLLQLGQVLSAMDRHQLAKEYVGRASEMFRRLGDRQSTAQCLLVQAELSDTKRSSLVTRALDLASQVQWHEGVEEARRLGALEPGGDLSQPPAG